MARCQRKLLELLFDGKPEAEAKVAANAKAFFDEVAAKAQALDRTRRRKRTLITRDGQHEYLFVEAT